MTTTPLLPTRLSEGGLMGVILSRPLATTIITSTIVRTPPEKSLRVSLCSRPVAIR
ncbi:hypothetical protein [Acidilobus sp.]|jgi:hypothetical protein|uniref:hypothetical protein n=1 Tax=Acidilobus sp. TaxID=1872109 RepID=UPI003CFD233F